MQRKPIQKYPPWGDAIKLSYLVLLTLVLTSCGEDFRFEDFTFTGSTGRTEKAFYKDSKTCQAEKNKYSNKIQGREFGFRGLNEGYLGCMMLRGWQKKEPRLY